MKSAWFAILVLLTFGAAAVYGQNATAPEGANDPVVAPAARREASLDLAAIVERVAQTTGREFVVDPRLPRGVYVGDQRIEAVTYPMLLSILRVHRWFAVEIDGRTVIMPDANARQAPTKLLQRDDPTVSDHEYVTRVIRVRDERAPREASTDGAAPLHGAAQLVPVLRALIPVEGHLAAVGDHLIVVDRYDNVRRITALVAALEP